MVTKKVLSLLVFVLTVTLLSGCGGTLGYQHNVSKMFTEDNPLVEVVIFKDPFYEREGGYNRLKSPYEPYVVPLEDLEAFSKAMDFSWSALRYGLEKDHNLDLDNMMTYAIGMRTEHGEEMLGFIIFEDHIVQYVHPYYRLNERKLSELYQFLNQIQFESDES